MGGGHAGHAKLASLVRGLSWSHMDSHGRADRAAEKGGVATGGGGRGRNGTAQRTIPTLGAELCGDAPASSPWQPQKSTVAGPLLIFRQALSRSHGWEDRRCRPSLRDLAEFIDREPTFETVGYYRTSRRDEAGNGHKSGTGKRGWGAVPGASPRALTFWPLASQAFEWRCHLSRWNHSKHQ